MENFRDAELKKWLAEEYEKETEEMEKILFPDGVIPDDGETEEEAKAAYQRLVEKLKADGVYKEDEADSIKTDDHKENVKIVYLPEKKSHKAARVAAAVLVCSASIFAASMTSQANRSYFIDSVRYWVGDDTKIVVDNDRTNEKEYEDEQTAIDDIEEELGVDIPRFLYRPEGLEFKDYNISKDFEYALLQYDIDDLLGQWTGVVKVVATAFGINQVLSLEENTQIVKNPGGNGYIFQLPMTRLLGATIVLAVTYQDGALVITTPQQQNYALSDGQGGVMYGSIITKTDDGLYLQGKIILSPVLMNDGQVALAYITDAYMSMGLFKGRVPSTANYAGLSIDFPAILMQYAE